MNPSFSSWVDLVHLWPTFNPALTHLLCFSHGGEQITSHDVVWDAFASIMINTRFHVSHKQIHVLPPLSFQFSCSQVDIMLLANGIHTLANVVIIDPT